MTYTSPASLSVGAGKFPEKLSAELLWHEGEVSRPWLWTGAKNIFSTPQTPWTTNWNNTASMGGSGLEMMGQTDPRAAAGTIGAFLAMQDIWKQAASTQREVAGVLANAWWVKTLTGTMVTTQVGLDSKQFVQLVDGTWLQLAPGRSPRSRSPAHARS